MVKHHNVQSLHTSTCAIHQNFSCLSQVSAVLKKFVSKDATLKATILTLTWQPSCVLYDVILSNSKLAARRKTCNCLLLGKMYFSKQISTSLSSYLFHVWSIIIWLQSSHNPEWKLKGFSEAIWTKCLKRNDFRKALPGCWVLFEMVATMSNLGLFWRQIS